MTFQVGDKIKIVKNWSHASMVHDGEIKKIIRMRFDKGYQRYILYLEDGLVIWENDAVLYNDLKEVKIKGVSYS